MDISPYLPQILSLLGTALLAAVGFIMRTLAKQNATMGSQSQALAVLIAKVGPAIDNVATTQTHTAQIVGLDTRLKSVEQELPYLRGAIHSQGTTVQLSAPAS